MIRHISLIKILCSILLLSFSLAGSCRQGLDPVQEEQLIQTIPYLYDIQIDGKPGDWPEEYIPLRLLSDIYGNIPDPSDFSARFRLAWDREGLLVLAEINDDLRFEDPGRFWNGDGMEIFLSPRKGSFDIVQISVRPSYDLDDPAAAVQYYDHRKSEKLLASSPVSFFRSGKTGQGYSLEGRIPLEVLGISEPDTGTEIAVQLYINDADMENDSMNYSLPWYPVRESYRNPYAFHRVMFSEVARPAPTPEVRAYIIDDSLLYIAVHSDKPCKGSGFEFHSSDFKEHINFPPGPNGIYTQQWIMPVSRFASVKERLLFLRGDSLFCCLDLCMLHRSYENIPEPNRFEAEIRIFEIMDHFNPPPSGSMLFTGSSTIRTWHKMERDFPGISLVNRGFGGSTMKDLNHYAHRIVFPYSPASIFIYEGDNDIARGASPPEFIEECRKFILLCSRNIPDTEIYFLSIKPSPARIRDWAQMSKANRMLADLASGNEKVHFINISLDMLNVNGTPRNDIFESDSLHLNDAGYEILKNALTPHIYK